VVEDALVQQPRVDDGASRRKFIFDGRSSSNIALLDSREATDRVRRTLAEHRLAIVAQGSYAMRSTPPARHGRRRRGLAYIGPLPAPLVAAFHRIIGTPVDDAGDAPSPARPRHAGA
jgi:hypothetical protein